MFVDSRFESLHVTTNPRVTKKMWRHKRNYWQRESGIRSSREGVSRTQEGREKEGSVTGKKEESLILRRREER